MTTEHIAELDSIHIPLNGAALIEAAAGTGKTYNIQNLTARMIVEKNFTIDSIAVVTFTEAAARELAERLHTVLEALNEKLLGQKLSHAAEDKRTDELIKHFDEENISRKDQQKRIQEALKDFDNNRVSTIHGFCARILAENAFECSIAFRVRLEKNIDIYVEKLLKDFCRIIRFNQQQLPGMENLAPDGQLHKMIKTLLERHELLQEYKDAQVPPTSDNLLGTLNSVLDEFYQIPIEDLVGELTSFKGKLNKINSYGTAEFLQSSAEQLRSLLATPRKAIRNADYQQWYEVLQYLPRSFILSKANKQQKGNAAAVESYVDSCRIFDLSETFTDTFRQFDLCWKLEAGNFVRRKLAEWKLRDNFQGFDDLLLEVAKALRSGSLAEVLRNKFKAGIIDEFQDTDPLQYEIFRSIFIEGRSNAPFFMVGDPRQAIYSFRSGDLATYMQAKAECMALEGGAIYKLSRNFRSSGPMIDAFNLIFEHDNLFAENAIQLGKTLKPDTPDGDLVRVIRQVDGQSIPRVVDLPLQLEYNTNGDNSSLYRNCARQIINLLNSKEFFLSHKGQLRPVTPGDIAVLAHTNDELQLMRDLLTQGNVPVCGERKSGVWSSAEAAELADFMQAILSNDESSIRMALTGNLGGLTENDLDLQSPDAMLRRLNWQQNMKQLNECWHNAGTSAMMRMLFRMDFSGGESTFKSRMSCRIGGERVIANMTQLGDLLAEEEYRSMLPPRGVLNFLRERIMLSENSDENSEMLDSNQTAVKLITIHKSKGLQFPIVFIPNAAAYYPMRMKGMKVYHRNGRLCCNPDEKLEDAKFLAALEELQEQLRLLYVAITRACSGCYISFDSSSKPNSPIHWICSMRSNKDAENIETVKNFLSQSKAENSDITVFGPPELFNDALKAQDSQECYQPEITADEIIKPETVNVIANRWRILSYSSLPVNGRKSDAAEQLTDRDEADELSPNQENTPGKLSGGIWDIPGGAAIGNAWHKLLEETDFTAPLDRMQVKRTLALYNFSDAKYENATCQMLENLLSCRLPCGMVFNQLSPDKRLCEFEFLLAAANGISLEKLLKSVEPYLTEKFGNTYQAEDILQTQGGFFGGFIDMIFEYQNCFYIVDWKSNTLEFQAGNFTGEALQNAMFNATYPLQYLCYLAALMRYLEQKLNCTFDQTLYDKYIGGVYYVFLRGLQLGSNCGIFNDRPDYQTIRALCNALCGNAAERICR